MPQTHNPADLFALGNTLLGAGEPHAAIEAFRRCLARAPSHADTLYNLGNALRQAGKPVEAAESFLSCLRARPDFGAAYINLAQTLRHLGALDQAKLMATRGLRHLPNAPEAMVCLANVHHDRAEYEPAVALYAQALRIAPSHAGWLTSLGNTLHAMGNLVDALKIHDRAVAAAPGDADTRFNRGTTRLAAGDFPGGWEDYEWRWHRSQARPRGFGEPWQGEALNGRTILLHAEQGLGDTLQFVRYASMVAARDCRVLLEVQPPLTRLLTNLSGITILAKGEPLPRFDTRCPLLSLPRAFATNLETIPAAPYLRADPKAVATWNLKLPGDGKPRVGLVWSGSPHNDDPNERHINRRRSIPMAAFVPLGNVPGLHLISLQKHDPQHAWTPEPGLTLIDPMAEVIDFADTAALIMNLDLVITVDTAVAHLAGGLGAPVWLLSRYDNCWRWLHNRDDSPWYPTMRLYRQPRPHDWESVIAQVRADLTNVARQN